MQFGMASDALLRQAITKLRQAGFNVKRIRGPAGNDDTIHVVAKSQDAESGVERIVYRVDPGAIRFGL
jgi:hypothetical protein